MTFDQVIKFYGSQSLAAKALGYTQPAISNWKARGRVPPLVQLSIEKRTKQKLRADPECLALRRAA